MEAATGRMEQLRRMLEKNPDDPFLLYGIAMEHKKAGQSADAVSYFNRVLERDPGYCYAYHQRGLVHEIEGDFELAKESYRQGIAAARKKGDAHAAEEIAGALSMIE